MPAACSDHIALLLIASHPYIPTPTLHLFQPLHLPQPHILCLNPSSPLPPLFPSSPPFPRPQVVLKDAEEEGDPPTIIVHLWRADMVTGVVEVDHGGTVTKPACCALHPR